MGLTRSTIGTGSWILLSYLLCQHVLVMGREHHRFTQNEETVKSKLQSSSESELVQNATLSETTEQSNKTSENVPPLPAEETVQNLLKHYLQEKLGDVVTNEDLMRHRRHVKVTKYVLMLYSTMQEMDMLQTGQEHIGHAVIPTIRSHKAYFTRENPRRFGRETRSLQFTIDQSKTTNITRCEIAMKLRRSRGMTQYDTFQLHVHITGVRVFKVGDAQYIRHAEMGSDWVQYTARRFENFLIFDVSSEVHNLPRTIYSSQYLFAENTSTGETAEFVIKRRDEPVVVVYENMEENPLFKSPTRSRRDVNTSPMSTPRDRLEVLGETPVAQPLYDSYSHCKRHDWTIDLSVFNWDFLMAPSTFNAGFCKGGCTPPLASEHLNTTTYSFIKNLWQYKTNYLNDLIPQVCCTPVLYHSQSLIYINKAFDAVLMSLPDAKVAACGCR